MEVWESNTYEGYPALAKMYAGMPYGQESPGWISLYKLGTFFC